MMKIDTSKYKVWNWKHPYMLHWIINPGLAFNELVLGQRVAKTILVEKDKSKSLAEASFVLCPHCNTLHDSRTWSTQNNTAFKNWFGLYCPNCGETIPCLLNLTSAIILVLTYPVWGWFRTRMKQKWLIKQSARFSSIDMESITPEFSNKNWIKMGLTWGLLMFFFMSLVSPWLSGESITQKFILGSLVIWTLTGLAFGYTMHKLMKRKLLTKA